MSDPEQPTLEGLREYFTARLPERMTEMDSAFRAARDAGFTGDALRTFHRLAHSLAGAGGTFGFPRVSEAARDLERLLNTLLKRETPPDEAEAHEIGERLAAIHAVV